MAWRHGARLNLFAVVFLSLSLIGWGAIVIFVAVALIDWFPHHRFEGTTDSTSFWIMLGSLWFLYLWVLMLGGKKSFLFQFCLFLEEVMSLDYRSSAKPTQLSRNHRWA